MRVKFILPALAEAETGNYRPIKYSLFPPLGLATLAGYLRPDDEAELFDQHVEPVTTDDEPDLVAIQVYITNAGRAYAMADDYRRRGVFVVLGGLHPTSLPGEALQHADALVLGPAHQAWPEFLRDFRAGRCRKIYTDNCRSLDDIPPVRRDLIRRRNYLVPNSIVVSRGCPQSCDFCYTRNFFAGGPAVLYGSGGEDAAGDRRAAGAPFVFSGRQPVRRAALRPGAFCGDGGDEPGISGGRDGAFLAG